MHDFFYFVGSNLAYFYSLALLVSLLFFRCLNSHSLICILVLASELVMHPLINPLRDFTVYLGKDYGVFAWYFTWIFIDIVFLYFLYLFHCRMNISTGKLYIFVSGSYLAMAVLQCIGFVDSTYLNSELLDSAYRYGILSISISIVFVLFWDLRRFKLHGKYFVYADDV